MKFLYYLSVCLLALLLPGCTSEDEVVSSGEVVSVRFAPAMEMTQDSTVPSRSISEVPTIIYAVQIYSNGTPMYYGLFDNPDSMTVALSSGRDYSMKMAAFQAGTGAGLKYKMINGKSYYYLPDEIELSNKFEDGSRLTDINQLSNCILSDTTSSSYPEIDAFYMEKNFKVSSDVSSIPFNLKRVSFAVHISVKGLTSGKVVLSFDNQNLEFTPQQNDYRSIRAFSGNENGIAIVAATDTYYEEIPVTAHWFGTNGTVVSCGGVLSLKRNTETPVSINLNSVSSQITLEGWYKSTFAIGEQEKQSLLTHINAGRTIRRIDRRETLPEIVFDNDSSVMVTDRRTASLTLNEDSVWCLNGISLRLRLVATAGSMSVPREVTFPQITLGKNRHWYVDGEDCGIEAIEQSNEFLSAPVTAIYTYGNYYLFSFSDGTTAKVLRSFYNPYSTAGEVRLKGQLHCHSTNSKDGTLSPSQLAERFKRAGYDFFTITDHDFVTPEPEGNELIWLCNSYESTKKHHLCIYNATKVVYGEKTIKEVIDVQLRNKGTFVGLPHPNDAQTYVTDDEVINECGNVTFVDVFNPTMNTSRGENGPRALDLLLSNGHRVFAVAVDDFHAENHIKRGWVEVLAQSRDPKDIIDALQKGAFFAKNAPSIVSGKLVEYAKNNPNILSVEFKDNILTVRNDNPIAITRFYGEGGVQLGENIVGETAVYAVKGNEKYVRAEVEVKGFYSWAQPVIIQL